jgi:predicted histidine transporter YuiF (NhaC family)
VAYFDFSRDGVYTIKVSNISENSINVQIEFGDTHSQKMIAPGIMILVGSLIMMLISYLKIKNYNIEQPDENIS